MSVSQLEWQFALSTIVEEAKKRNGNIRYASAYALAGVNMRGEERSVQANYILANLSHWRGESARKVKEILKQIAKEFSDE